MNDNFDNNEDTVYFGNDNPNIYENNQKPYTEDDMYEDYKPLTNVNSTEYDEGDYAYSNYEAEDEDGRDSRKKIIIGYIITLVLIIIIIIISVLKSK